MELVPCADRARFDAFVAASPNGHVHQTFAWGDVKAQFGWTPLRLVAEREGRVVAAVSLLKTTRRGIPVLYASRGPVADWGDRELAAGLLDALGALARREGVAFVRISPAVPAGDDATRALLAGGGWLRARKPLQHTATSVLRLEGRSPEELLASFHEKTRYNIRLAAKSGVEVRKGGEADLDVLHGMLVKTGERQGIETFPPGFFKAVHRALAPAGMAVPYLAYAEGRPAGGLLLLRLAGKAWYMWGGFDYEQRKRMPSHALHWTAIQDCLRDGVKTYDLQGMPEDPGDDPLQGIHNFKRGFRGDDVSWIGEWDRPARLAPLYRAAHAWGLV
jgi:peptidoglycan pentaglycine glycine transferase (the first glycine)